MNVTIKIKDDLVKKARHEAVDDGLSLSGWIAQLIDEKLSSKEPQKSLLDILGNDEIAEIELDLSRNQSTSRELSFD